MKSRFEGLKKDLVIFSCLVTNKDNSPIPSFALIDSGASAYGFINTKFVRNNNLKTINLSEPRILKVFDGSETTSGEITQMAHTNLNIEGHVESVLLFVTQLAHFDIVLGLPWLQLHDPEIRWSDGVISFSSKFCKRHSNQYPLSVKSLPDPRVKKLKQDSQALDNYESLRSLDKCDTLSFEESVKRDNLNIMAVSIEDIEEALRDKPKIDPAKKLPEIYHEFLPVFSRDEADKLPPHRPSDHRIILKPGCEAPWGPLYGMSREELSVLKKYITENLEKGFIRPSTSPASSPVLFVKKPGGGLRFCVDYRALNDLTIKNRYPIPRIHETLTLLGKAKYFSKGF